MRLLLALTLAVALVGTPARAAVNLAVSRFDASPAGDRFFGVDSPTVGGPLALDGRLTLDWAHQPLVLHDSSSGATTDSVLENQAFAVFGATLRLMDRIAITFDAPVALVQSAGGSTLGGTGTTLPSGAHVGDFRLGLRVPVYAYSELVMVSVGGFLWAPLGSSSSASGAYASDGRIRGRLEVLVGGENDRWAWTVGVGPDLRRSQTYLGVKQGSMVRVTAAGGLFLLPDRRWQVGLELASAVLPGNVNRYTTNAELLLGTRFRFPAGLELGLAGGPGLTSGIGTPAYRIVAMATYLFGNATPSREPEPEPEPEPLVVTPLPAPEPPPPPPPDRDGDGIPDTVDACIDVPGVASAEPAKNGCPSDRDGDGILDTEDSCPDVFGYRSTVAGKNGCPDDDGDEVPGPEDACPHEFGHRNADPKKNGCPTGAVVDDQIVLVDQVRFANDSDVILPESDKILQTVLTAIGRLPPDKRIRIEGHTDNRGPLQHNHDLSQRRATSVIAWMVKHGLDKARFDAAGFGPDRPIATNDTDAGRQQNRRVEFHIVE